MLCSLAKLTGSSPPTCKVTEDVRLQCLAAQVSEGKVYYNNNNNNLR